MIKVNNTEVEGWTAAIRGMRNPYDSWAKSDSHVCPRSENFVDCKTETEECPRHGDFKENVFCIGKNDMELMKELVKAGDCHAKFARYIVVTADVTAPLYWWKEYDTYKVGTVADSCSTMHTIMKKPFERDDFSYKQDGILKNTMPYVIQALNDLRFEYMHESSPGTMKDIWRATIQLLPESYNQKRTVLVNYQVLRNMYRWRHNHKLIEWHQFCAWIESLPYAKELIIPVNEEEKA